jgi:lactate dehydrogenase-like 2-hydroxyacid dehydrogenase
MKVRIGITEPEYNKSKHIFNGTAELECIPVPVGEAQLAKTISELEIKHIIVGAEKYQDEVYRSLSSGSVIARFGVGHDGIDKKLASKFGIFCTNTPGVLNDSVAEFTISLILTAARQIIKMSNQCRAGIWQPYVGSELKHKRLAVVGCGPIGRNVSRIASFGFQMYVVGYEIAEFDQVRMEKEFGFKNIYRDFGKTVENADFVSLHIPSNTDTYHFLNEKRIELIPDKAWLINTARGAVVDENALFKALSKNRLAGAALDVFENEPYIPAGINDLRSLDNVIMLPHLGSSTKEACDGMALKCLNNIHYAEEGNYSKLDLLNSDLLEKFPQ